MKTVLVASIILATGLMAGRGQAEEWNPFSSSARTAYLADVGSMSVLGDDTTIRIARVPVEGPAGDYSHKVGEMVLRCGAKQFRTVLELEYGPDGAELARYEEPEAPWDDIPENGLGAYVKAIACDGERGTGANSPSIQAFIDSGRRK